MIFGGQLLFICPVYSRMIRVVQRARLVHVFRVLPLYPTTQHGLVHGCSVHACWLLCMHTWYVRASIRVRVGNYRPIFEFPSIQ